HDKAGQGIHHRHGDEEQADAVERGKGARPPKQAQQPVDDDPDDQDVKDAPDRHPIEGGYNLSRQSPQDASLPYTADGGATSQSKTAFCTCRRFAAWRNTTDRCPSSTSSAISSPRWAGRSCMTMASGRASRTRSRSTR